MTERFAKGASTERRKSPIFYDDGVIGFGLQVRDNGRKTFTLDYTVEGRRRRYFISDPSPGACRPPANESQSNAAKVRVGSGAEVRDDR